MMSLLHCDKIFSPARPIQNSVEKEGLLLLDVLKLAAMEEAKSTQ